MLSRRTPFSSIARAESPLGAVYLTESNARRLPTSTADVLEVWCGQIAADGLQRFEVACHSFGRSAEKEPSPDSLPLEGHPPSAGCKAFLGPDDGVPRKRHRAAIAKHKAAMLFRGSLGCRNPHENRVDVGEWDLSIPPLIPPHSLLGKRAGSDFGARAMKRAGLVCRCPQYGPSLWNAPAGCCHGRRSGRLTLRVLSLGGVWIPGSMT